MSGLWLRYRPPSAAHLRAPGPRLLGPMGPWSGGRALRLRGSSGLGSPPYIGGGSSLRCRTLLWVAVHVLHSLVSESQSRCERTCRGMSPATTAIEHAVANSANKKIR